MGSSGRRRSAGEGREKARADGDLKRLPRRSLASPSYGQPGGAAVCGAAAQGGCGQALREGGSGDSGRAGGAPIKAQVSTGAEGDYVSGVGGVGWDLQRVCQGDHLAIQEGWEASGSNR